MSAPSPAAAAAAATAAVTSPASSARYFQLTSAPITIGVSPSQPSQLRVTASRAIACGEVIWYEESTAVVDRDALQRKLETSMPGYQSTYFNRICSWLMCSLLRDHPTLREWENVLAPRLLAQRWNGAEKKQREEQVVQLHDIITRFQASYTGSSSSPSLPTPDDLDMRVAKVFCNWFVARGVTSNYSVMFGVASMFNHACAPNARPTTSVTAGGVGQIGVMATRDIAVGEEVTTSYIDTLCNDEKQRGKQLLPLGFRCLCRWCTAAADVKASANGTKGVARVPPAVTTQLGHREIFIAQPSCLWCGKISEAYLRMVALRCNQNSPEFKEEEKAQLTRPWVCCDACKMLCETKLSDFVMPPLRGSLEGERVLKEAQQMMLAASALFRTTGQQMAVNYEANDRVKLLTFIHTELPAIEESTRARLKREKLKCKTMLKKTTQDLNVVMSKMEAEIRAKLAAQSADSEAHAHLVQALADIHKIQGMMPRKVNQIATL